MLLENGNIQIVAKDMDGKIMYEATCSNYNYFNANFCLSANDSR